MVIRSARHLSGARFAEPYLALGAAVAALMDLEKAKKFSRGVFG